MSDGAKRQQEKDAPHAKYFEELGENFEAFMSDYDVERRLSLIFDELLADCTLEGARVLEVGCGTGRFTMELVRRGADLVALDIGLGLVEKSSRSSSCSGTAASACCLPFADESFDVIVSSECIEHTPSPEEAIAEMARVCRPGGRVCLTTPNRLWYPVLWLSQVLRVRKFAGPERWIWPGTAVELLRERGFDEIKVSGCHLWPFQLGFSRPVLRRIDALGAYLYPLMINFGAVARRG